MENSELLRRLREIGVTVAKAHYDGYGDSGSVDFVEANGPEGKTIALPEELDKAIGEAAESYLEDKSINWFDNEGGFGEYILDVAAGTQRLEHNTRVSDTEYEEHEDALELPSEGGSESLASPAANTTAAVCTCPTLLNGHRPDCPFVAKEGA